MLSSNQFGMNIVSTGNESIGFQFSNCVFCFFCTGGTFERSIFLSEYGSVVKGKGSGHGSATKEMMTANDVGRKKLLFFDGLD